MEKELAKMHCIPCEGGVPPLTPTESAKYLLQLKDGWEFHQGKLRRRFIFTDFATALAFAARIGQIAEKEGHHPDLHVGYGKLTVELWTHAIHGLSENDFVLAAKIDQLD